MIEKYYPSKRPPPVLTNKFQSPVWNGAQYTESYKAQQRGLSIEEYRERVAIVAKALIGSKWVLGAVGYPHTKDDMEEHGQCRVVAIVSHYDHYGKIDWNPECPYLLAVRPTKGDVSAMINCSIGWLVEEDPCLLKMEC